MKNIGLGLFLASCLIAVALTQNFNGGLIPHVYTGFATAQLANEILANVTYTSTLDRSTFDTTEQINIATSLREYSLLSPNPTNPPAGAIYYAHIEIINPRLSDNRQIFQFNIKTLNTQANVLNIPTRIKHVGLNFIIIGSAMGGYYTTSGIPSSYIFARNSDMFVPVSNPGLTLVDFKAQTSGNAESPFLYDPTNTKYAGCGAAKRDGYWIIQTKACSHATATLFITGFDETIKRTGVAIGSNKIEIGATTSPQKQNEIHFNLFQTSPLVAGGPYASFTTDSTKDGLLLTLGQNTAAFTNALQLSMVVITLREYTPVGSTYPLQGVFVDNFNANTFVDATVPVIGPQPLPATFLLTRFATAPAYNDIEQANFGHRFCGYHYLEVQGGSSLNIGGTNSAGFTLNPNNDPNPNFVSPNQGDLYLDKKAVTGFSDVTNGVAAQLSCLQFTSKNPCVRSTTNIPIRAPSVVISTSTVAATAGQPTATVAFTGAASATPYSSSSDPILLNPVDFFSQQTMTEASTIVYTSKVALSSVVVGVYEGVLYFTIASAPTGTPTPTLTVRINVFGTDVVYDTITAFVSPFIYPYHFSFQNTQTTNNNIVITFVSSGAIPTTILEFGLFSNANVIDFDNKCTSKCSNSPGNSIGINYLTNPPQCVNCDTTLNLFFDSTKGACACIPGFTFVSSGCQGCTYTLCASCKAGVNTCDRCADNAVFVNTADVSKGCVCIAGYYRSGSQCLKCAPGCATCTTSSVCATCLVNSNTRKAEIDNCACKPGFYEAGTPVCPACSSECLTCETSATRCLTCDTANFFEKVGTTCQCKKGYYLSVVNGKAQCLKCYFACAECVTDAAQCTKCVSNTWTLTSDNKCVCNKVYQPITVYYDNLATVEGICVQRPCSQIDPNCIECYMVMLTGQPFCKLCNEGAGWTLSANNKTCVCQSGYLQVGNTCQKCGTGCSTCNPVSTCTQCANGAVPSGPANCQCIPGSYLTTAYGPLQCMPCDPNCASCQIQPFICTKCINGFTTDNNRCVCSGARFTLDGVYCNACPTGCTKCTNSNTCQACQVGYFSSAGRCLLQCPDQTFDGGDKCIQCSEFCRTCSSANYCKACKAPYLLYLGTCRATCPQGTYAYQQFLCTACNSNCKTCSGNPNNCSDCKQGLVLSGTQCLPDCNPGTYYNGKQCVSCAATCGDCVGTATTCTSCPAGQYFYNGQCYSTCPTAMVAGVCTNICQDGFYLSGTSCLKCSSICQTCSALNVCTSCKTNFFNYNGQCISKCPTNTIASGTSCLECDPNCVSCSGAINSCVSCKPGTFRLADRCYSTCPQSYYPDSATSTCKQCDANCKSCIGPGQCAVCTTDATPVSGLCAPSCGANCLTCTDNICTNCAPNLFWNGVVCQPFCPSGATASNGFCVCPTNQYLHLGNCVASCPSTYTNVNGQCRSCVSPCSTCSSSTSTCSSCISGYEFDPVNKRCTKSTTCDYGQYYTNFQTCLFICPENNYYHDSACYVGLCPVGYTPNDRARTCVKSTLPNGCNSPLYLQGTQCVNSCDSGFYPDQTTRVCSPCSSNCAVCSGPSTCLSCSPGSALSQGVCVVSPLTCPSSQARYNDICVSSCPSGTFNKDGFCVRLCGLNRYFWQGGCYQFCPSNLRTADACVLVCPTGFMKKDSICVAISNQQCSSNQYFNSAIGACDNCRSPCASCLGNPTFCTSCPANFDLRSGGICVSSNTCAPGLYSTPSGCQKCSSKCATCTDFNVCTSCALGFTNTGADCAQTGNLASVDLRLSFIVKRDTTVYIQLSANILPRNIPSSLGSQIVLYIPSLLPNPASKVSIWVIGFDIYIALQHTGPIPSYQATFVLNSQMFDTMFRSIGYTTADAFVQVPISNNLSTGPSTLTIPIEASFSRFETDGTLRINKALNRALARAVSWSGAALN